MKFIHGKVRSDQGYWFHSRIAKTKDGRWYVPPCMEFPRGGNVLHWQAYPLGDGLPYYSPRLKKKIEKYLRRIAPYKRKYAQKYLKFVLGGCRGKAPERPRMFMAFMQAEAIRARIQTLLEI